MLRVLGPVGLDEPGQVADMGSVKQRLVLAALLVDAGRLVTVSDLVDRLWDDDPPPEARKIVYSHVSRVRRVLEQAEGPVRLDRLTGGYLLQVDPDQVDIHRFQRLVERARQEQRDDDEQAALLRAALELWRGGPLAGLPGAWAAAVRARWLSQHADASVQWARAELRLDNHEAALDQLLDRLRGLMGEHPLAEPLAVELMRALHLAGRDAEALAEYDVIRSRLADELGADPGPELQALHQAILRGELERPVPAVRPVRPVQAVENAQTVRAVRRVRKVGSARPDRPKAVLRARGAPRARGRPAQLPMDVDGFAGRDRELAGLDAILARASDQPASTLVAVLTGMAGVGKTALAVHWAHQVRHRFPDGQLYVNLRGFDPGGPAISPGEAVRALLDGLGADPARIPVGLEAQAGLYRSLLASRRVLVVLDNAKDAEQVRPLLPGAPGCLVIVTSRNDLTGLLAAHGARPLSLDLLTLGEARRLLALRLGEDRVSAEPDAADEIITGCARLPLALTLVAARAASHPGYSLATLAGELREFPGSLDAFDSGDPATDLRAVFSWSYQALSADAARLFRLLGLPAGPDTTAVAAASLAAIAPRKGRRLLAELTRAHLLTEHTPGRHTQHDLVRAYAAELVQATEPDAERGAALGRLLTHYLHTAHSAALSLSPHREEIALAPADAGAVPAERFASYEQAMAWFTAEHAVLLAAVEQAASLRLDVPAWQLAWTLADFLNRQGHWHDRAATQLVALSAARRLGDRPAQAHAHRYFGYTQAKLGGDHTHLQRALDLYGQLGDRLGQARTHESLAEVLGQAGRHAEALDHARQALDGYREAGDEVGQAGALNAIGWHHAQLGSYQQAVWHCEQALALHQEIGGSLYEAHTWDSLGYAHHALGHHQSISCYQRALDLYRGYGARYYEGATLTRLGDARHTAGESEAARAAWHHGLAILDQLGHPDAAQVRARLGALKPRLALLTQAGSAP
jgi:DNA-binding SARP family transcriptional activator